MKVVVIGNLGSLGKTPFHDPPGHTCRDRLNMSGLSKLKKAHPGWLGFIRDELLPSYNIGIIISHYILDGGN